MKASVRSLGLIVAAGAAAAGGYAWWSWSGLHPSTDDAYVQADIINIAPEIGGRVTEVAVTENARVAAGDVLFTLDARALTAARDAAQAAVDLADQAVGATGAGVPAAEAQLAGAQAQLTEATTSQAREQALFASGDVAQAAVDSANTAADAARAAVAAAQANLQAAQAQSGAAGADNARIRAARASLIQAEIALSHATVRAPADGWVANLTLRPGQVVAEGAPLFALVADGPWWIDANFKETDIARIRPGQPADIAVDMYPGVTVTGHVDSLGAGSGAAFSLLPPENATGNWVKVTQRFPVRIAIDQVPADPATPLRVGASATVTVDTTATPAAGG